MLKKILIALIALIIGLAAVAFLFVQVDKAIQIQERKYAKQVELINEYKQQAAELNSGEYIE